MLQRRGGSAGQLGGMRSTCPVHAGSPLIAVCQPEKDQGEEEGGGPGEGDQEGGGGKEGMRRTQRGREKEDDVQKKRD